MSKTAREVIAGVRLPAERHFTLGAGTADLTEQDADILIAALASAGYEIVPKEPTEDARSRAGAALKEKYEFEFDYEGLSNDCLNLIYRAMIAAAKGPP